VCSRSSKDVDEKIAAKLKTRSPVRIERALYKHKSMDRLTDVMMKASTKLLKRVLAESSKGFAIEGKAQDKASDGLQMIGSPCSPLWTVSISLLEIFFVDNPYRAGSRKERVLARAEIQIHGSVNTSSMRLGFGFRRLCRRGFASISLTALATCALKHAYTFYSRIQALPNVSHCRTLQLCICHRVPSSHSSNQLPTATRPIPCQLTGV
ncbi:6773_t:CDS:2, partial [Acaulospora colombiana]